METVGRAFELVGAIITFVGLIHAWRRLSKRDMSLRSGLRNLETRLRRLAEQAPSVSVRLELGGEGTASARVVKQINRFDKSEPVEDQIDKLVDEQNRIQLDMAAVRDSITALEGAEAVTKADVEERIRAALKELESELDESQVSDLIPALIGIGMTIVGIVLGVFA